MLKFFKKSWWKLLSIIFLLFSTSAALLIPLSSGIQNISPEKLEAGNTYSLNVYGYNTNFKAGDPSLVLLLKNESLQFCADAIEVKSPSHFIANIHIPEDISIKEGGDYFTAIINNNEDGSSLMRRALKIEQNANLNSPLQVQKNYCNRSVELQHPSHITFPNREILYESIRNLFFHVPMWFAMTLLLLVSFIASIKFLGNNKLEWDLLSKYSAYSALFFGFLGIITGMIWANYTWGAPWVNDPKLNGAAVGMLIYLAYFILRGSVTNPSVKRKISSVYNIFAFVLFIVFIFVLPRMTDSLHPGNGGNPGFSSYDLDNTMRPVFYTAILGFFLLGLWITGLFIRVDLIKEKKEDENY